MWQVIYQWRGERHVDVFQFRTRSDANQRLALFRADGWPAWIEKV